MVTLPEFRQQYPEYNDLSDEDLTRKLHGKFYSDKPFDDFARRFGYTPPAPTTKPEVEDNTTTLGHVGEFLSGIPRGVANTGISAAQGVVALANLIAGDKPTESEWIKAMEEAQRHVTSKGWFAQKPGYEKSIPGQLGEGVGSIAAFALPGAGQAALTGRVTGGVAKAILPLAAVTGAGEAVDRLSQFKGDTSYGQQFWATMLGLPIGATDALPVQRMLGSLAKALGMAEKGAGQPIIDYVKRAIAQAGLEGGQEAVQSILQDLSEKYVYNPDKAVGETALSEFGIGAGSGAIAQIGGDILTAPFRRRAMARHREGVEEEIKKVRDQMEAENKLRTEYIEKATNPQLLLEDKSSPVKALPIPDIVYAPGTKEIVPEPDEDVVKYSERLGTKVFETLPNGRFRVLPSPKGHLIVGPGNYVIGNPVATIESAHKIAGDLNQRSLKRDVEEDARRALRRAAIGETGALLQTAKDTINPIAPFSRSDVGETSADLVNNERRKAGLPPLSEFGVKDLAEFLPLQDVQRLLKIRAPLSQEKVTPETIHALAKEKNIAWDNDVNFMEFSSRVTGSRHLDRMNGTQLLMLRDALRSMPTFDKKSSIPVMPHQRFTEEQYDAALGRAKRDGRLDHDTVQKATGLTKPEDVWALLEKMVDRGDARPMTSRVMRSERGDAFIRGDGSLIFLNKDGNPITSDSLRHRDKTVRKGEYELFGQNLTTETLPEGRSEFVVKPLKTKEGKERFIVTEARYGKQTIGVRDEYNHSPHDFLGEAAVANFDTRAEAEAYVAAQKEQPTFDRAGQPGIPITGAPHTGTAVKNWLEKIGLTPSKKAVEKSDLIEKSLRAKLDAVGLQDIRVKLANLAGAMKDKGDVPEGVYQHWQKTIYLALDAIPPGAKTDAQIAKALGQVLDHEMIHAMRKLDLFTDQEWKTLTRYVANKPSHTNPQQTYLAAAQEAYKKQFADMNPAERADSIIEEAVAEAFRGWVENVRNAAGQPAGLFNRIVQFLKRLRDAMQGRGFKSADEVFGEIGSGVVGRRERGVVRAVEQLPYDVAERLLRERARKAGVDVGPENATVDEKFSIAARNVNLDKPSFLLWFDQSKVVNADGSPKPLYHGTDADYIKIGKNMGFTMDTAMGYHLAVDPVIANRFAAGATTMSGSRPDRAGANVKPFYLASKNPYVIPSLHMEGAPGPEFDAELFDTHAIGTTIKDPAFFKDFYGSRLLREGKDWESVYSELKEGRMPDDVRRDGLFEEYLEAMDGDAFKAYARSVGVPENYTWAIKQVVPRFQKWLEANGYDSIQYTITAPAEVREVGFYKGDGDPINTGEEVDPTAYIVWKPEVLKSIFNEMSPKTLFGGSKDKFSIRANLDEATRDKWAVNKKRNYTPAIDAVVDKVGNMRSDETFGEKMIRITDAKPWTWFRQKFLNKYEAIGRNQRRLKQLGLATDAELLADAGAFQAAIMSDRAMGVMGAALRYGIPVWKDGRATVQKMGIDGKPVDGLIKIFEPVGNRNLWAEFKTYAVSVRAARLIGEKNKDGTPREKFMTPAEISEGLKLGTIYPEFKKVFEEYQRWNSGLVKFMVDTGVIDAKMGDVWMETSDYIPFYREFDGEGSLQGRHKMARSMFNSLTDQKPAKQLKGDDAAINDIAENIMQNARAAITAGMKNMAAQRALRDMMKLNEGVQLADRADAHHGRVVTVREKGVDKHYQVDDKLLYNALTGMDARDLGIMKIFTEPARILRELVTKDPGFMAANLMRDTLSAWVTSGRAFTPFYSTGRGVLQELKGSVSAKALEYSGVYGGFDFVGDIQSSGRKLQNQYNKSYGRAVWDKLERLTSASDAATRIAVYERTLKDTGSPAQAEFEALEVMNFSRKGSSRAVRILAAIVPFFNARIQGMDVLMRAAGGQNVGYTGRPDANAVVKRFWTRALFMIATTLAYYAAVSDDDDWKNATADERDNNWLIPMKGILGENAPAIKIPIPFEVGVLFKVIPERFSALVDGKDTPKDTLNSARRQAASNIPVSPEAMVPQFIKPLLESMVNYSFYRGREVESAYLRDLLPAERVSQGTSEIAKQMGAGVDMSPVRIDNIIKGYTGSLGTIAISLIDEGLRWAVNAPAKPDRRIEEYPIMRRFLQQSVPTGQLEQFYDIRNRAREVARTVSYLNNVGRADEAMKLIQREPELFTYSSALERMAKQISDLRRYRSVIENDKFMDGTTKRSMIDGIRQMELQMAEFGRTLKREIFK